MQIARQAFYDPMEIFQEVKDRINRITNAGEKIDYLSFVPDGEPTLDINLGKEIELLKTLGIKIAVITNASLLWDKDVREQLNKADWVSVKVDAVDEEIWRRIDHPVKGLSLNTILDGITKFSREFTGELFTETMLVKGINDTDTSLENTASFIATLNPIIAYLSIPTRPPADKRIEIPDENKINTSYQIFSKHLDKVEYLIGYEGNDFTFSGNTEEDILSITSVHPMRKDAVLEFLAKAGADYSIITNLVKENKLVQLDYDGSTFFMRKLFEKYKR
jgi:wyosine [tRNA(Phe)-imidazoG37] synthetase (radical SAM superfamily)